MAQQRRGLGKGLGALIPENQRAGGAPPSSNAGGPAGSSGSFGAGASALGSGPADGQLEAGNSAAPNEPVLRQIDGAYLEEVAVDAITPNPRQPRRHFDDEPLKELSASIAEVGLLQPVVVRNLGDGKYELVMGERRWRASTMAGLDKIPAIVRETADTDMLRDALLENLHRQELDPLEEAAAYQQLLDDFGATHEQLAQKIGRSRSHITNTLRLLSLPPKVQNRVAARIISAGHARTLLGLKDPEAQDRLAQRIVAEGLSVRDVEEIVQLDSDKPSKPARKARSSKPVSPAAERLAASLTDHFDTVVKVQLGQSRGKIIVEFDNLRDMDRIIKMMAPEASGTPRNPSTD